MSIQKGKYQFSDIQIYNFLSKNRELKFYLTWPVIILVFILFFPLGIYLIYRRTTEDKEAALKIYKVVNFIGWFFLIIAAMFVIDMSSREDYYSGSLSFYLVLGLFFSVWGRRLKAQSLRYKKYLSLVLINQKWQVNDIANILGFSHQKVKADLVTMIRKNYFPGGYFDESKGGMVFSHMDDSYNEDTDPIVEAKTRVITCKGCGASNSVVEGTIAECEYCGSKIEIDPKLILEGEFNPELMLEGEFSYDIKIDYKAGSNLSVSKSFKKG
ncbi:hypothetical protein Desde_0583 [Desulfitobacterium dehalogenans ATCC 51507]|uniref:Uncharacterized protein n=1 Tax=Desulfitobacterium dehalogenans (strain ATCC 51507 / DSM 9161 / JW/IU-DC1) TaxID=756499 RepID=I4A502_DESDJ|nr:hypothetical protein [Desulfitobacterium dehalogenans]AFL99036.1 hypothetical protein Desde_0583 [Desulfitobacterium dehalogenans ATCC 51507]